MPYSSSEASDKVGESIDKLVQDYNVKYSKHPIVVFQFVSLDATTNKNLIWWSHDQKEISEKYNSIVTEFIGKDKVERTLVTWEYDGDAFRYTPFGKGKILPVVKADNFKPGKTPDRIDLSKVIEIAGDKGKILSHWESLLQDGFKNGSTMWVSLPHTDSLNRLIYSSVFVLFNTRLPEKGNEPDKKTLLESYRLFRNFIIQYLIDHYRRPLIQSYIDLSKKLVELGPEISTSESSNLIKAKSYSFIGHKITNHFSNLENSFFQNKHFVSGFEEQIGDAKQRIKDTYDPAKCEFRQPQEDYKNTYTYLSKINIGEDAKFKFFLYGRLMILSYHIVFNLPLRKSWNLLINGNKPIYDFAELQKRFAIQGIKNDIKYTGDIYKADINLRTVIPFISDAEFNLLQYLCNEYKLPLLWQNIKDSRSVSY